jgi:hypothetical protein
VRWIALLLTFFSFSLYAHEITSVTQHVTLRKQDEVGLQQDVIAKINLNKIFDIGAQATYLERFDLFEKRVGGFMVIRPHKKWTVEARYLQGMGNEVLPEKQAILSAYYAAGPGYSPYVFYRDSRYSVTHLHTINFGVEIEKIANIILIPSFMVGKATFKPLGKTDDVHNYGLRAIYYVEKTWAFTLFGYKGKEASQGIIGRSTELVDTLSGGLGGTYYFTDELKADLFFDHTDYDQLNTEFHTTTLNISWMF